MMILTIDNTLQRLSCGLFDDDNRVFEFSTEIVKKQLSLLIPTMKYFFHKFKIRTDNIHLIAVTSGPGSFTGVRLSLATAKTLSQIFNIKIVPCSTLEVVARNITLPNCLICSVIDAKKKEVYAAFFEYNESKFSRITEDKIYKPQGLIDECLTREKNIMFVGDGNKIYQHSISSSLKDKAIFAPQFLWYPQSYHLAKIAQAKSKKGETKNWDEVVPVYLTEFKKVE